MSNHHLINLHVQYNDISDVGAEHLSKMKSLTFLNISNNNIGKTGAQHLSSMIFLTTLYISRSNIGNLGDMYLSLMDNLNCLDVIGNQIDDDGAVFLSRMRYLDTLHYSSNPISKQRIENLCAARQENRRNNIRELVAIIPICSILGFDIVITALIISYLPKGLTLGQRIIERTKDKDFVSQTIKGSFFAYDNPEESANEILTLPRLI